MPQLSPELMAQIAAGGQHWAIVCHFRPDGDAFGSSLGLAHQLRAWGHRVALICPGPWPDYLGWLPGLDQMQDGFEDPARTQATLDQADWVACLDFSRLDRTEQLQPLLAQTPTPLLVVDHHPEPETVFAASYHDTQACATCELLNSLLADVRAAHPSLPPLTPEAATCLYAGILTDSQNFRTSNTRPQTLRAAADLRQAGADTERVHHFLYHQDRPERLRCMGFLLYERMQVLPALHTAYITVSQDDEARFGLLPGETEGFVNLALSLRGVNLGVLLSEKPHEVRFSFRSTGQFAANRFAERWFNGGGHYNAAGGRLSGVRLPEAEAYFLEKLALVADELRYHSFT